MSMNPYEMRFKIIEAASNMLKNKYDADLTAWNAMNKDGVNIKDYPIFPSSESIREEAKKWNDFISDN